MPKFDVVIIGPFARDKNVLLGKERFSSGGIVYYSSFPLAGMGLKVAVVAKLAKKDFFYLEELRKEKISVFVLPSRKTFSCENIYLTKDLDKRISRLIARCDPFKLSEVSEIEAKIFQIGALIAGDVSFEVVEGLARKGKIALDVQGFIRGIGKEGKLGYLDWQEKKKILPLVEYLKLDKAETEFLTDEKDLKRGARKLAEFGSKEIVITSDLGVLVYTKGKFYFSSFTPKEIRGRTGRGDTCLATYFGKRLLGSPPEEACQSAANATSRKLEALGPLKGNLK